MPRFALKDLLIGMTIIAIGLGILVFAETLAPHHQIAPYKGLQAGLIGGGVMTVGSGIAYPFKRPWIGLAIGVILMWPAIKFVM